MNKKKLTAISSTYPQRAADIYEYVEPQLGRIDGNPSIHITSPPGTEEHVNDLGVVLCNFGTNKERQRANTIALTWLLCSKPKPYFVIVDAQRDGDDFAYSDLVVDDNRVFTINKTITEKSKGLFMKEALWNMGARYLIDKNIGVTKLVFLDMDLEFVDQMWAWEVSMQLYEYDCISPHMAHYYAGTKNNTVTNLVPSVGYSHATNSKILGFQGMAFGCTVDFYQNRLDNEIKLLSAGQGDTYLWYSILGNNHLKLSAFDLIHKHNIEHDRHGMQPRPKVGHGNQIIAHRDHGPLPERIYRQRYLLAKRCNYRSFDDYTIDDDGMPIWSNNISGILMSRLYPNVIVSKHSIEDVMNMYEQEAVGMYGAITPSHPLIVTCVLRSGGEYGPRHVIWLKEQFENKCLTPHRFVCLSDVNISGVETIPLTLVPNKAVGSSVQIEQYRDIWPKNASVLTCDLDTVLYRPFIAHRCPKNQFHMKREFDYWDKGEYCLWNCGLTYFRGDFSFLYDLYMRCVNGTEIQQPRYMVVGSQEFIVLGLRQQNIEPTTIEPHFCARFWNNSSKEVPPEASFVCFPFRPKPWDLNYSFIPPLPKENNNGQNNKSIC